VGPGGPAPQARSEFALLRHGRTVFAPTGHSGLQTVRCLRCRDSGYVSHMLLILGIILLIVAIAGGVIIHPVVFALAIVAIVLFFTHRRAAV
jgi:hypothetical protein